MGQAAKYGILIKDGQTIEVSDKVNSVLLDKTGTITEGKPTLSNMINYSSKTDEEIIRILRSIEQYSQHPLSSALFNNEDKSNFELYDVEDFENISGMGVVGKIDDIEYFIGNRKLLNEYDITIDGHVISDLENQESDMKTSIMLASNEKVLALVSVEDAIKENSIKAIDQLHKMNIETSMISGDNKNTSEIVARKVGIANVISEALPQEKLDYVKKLQKENRIVAFIGDGINDAPSLTKADVGIAIGTGTDVAIESGDMILINGDLTSAVAGLQLSKKVMGRVKLNLFWAFIYNIILIPIAGGVLIPWNIVFRPEYSAFAMALSSVTVITLSLLLKRYTPEILKEK